MGFTFVIAKAVWNLGFRLLLQMLWLPWLPVRECLSGAEEFEWWLGKKADRKPSWWYHIGKYFDIFYWLSTRNI